MRGVHVVRLGERFLGDLPVGTDHLGDVGLHVAVLEFPHLELLGQIAHEIVERLAVRIGVDEYEPAPRGDLALGQHEVDVGAFVDVREVPAGRNVGKRAVERPGEAVERAAQLGAVAVVVLESPSAVQAGIRVGLDRHVGLTNHDERHVGDFVHVVVAGSGDVLFSAGELPHTLPESFLLEFVVLARDVALDRYVGVAEESGRLEAEHGRHWMGVGVEQLLVRDARGAGQARVEGGHGSIIDSVVSSVQGPTTLPV